MKRLMVVLLLVLSGCTFHRTVTVPPHVSINNIGLATGDVTVVINNCTAPEIPIIRHSEHGSLYIRCGQ